MADCSLSQVQKEIEEPEMIQVFITEVFEVEAFSGSDSSVNCMEVRGKMSIGFPPESDRFVEIGLGKLDDLKLRSNPLIDKDVLRNMWIAKPKSPDCPFYTGPADILSWRREVIDVPTMIKINSESVLNKPRPEGVVCNMLDVRYKYTGPTPVQDLVIKIPLPLVDQNGEARRLLKTHIWHNTGAHVEREDCVEWHIGSVDRSNSSGYFTVDFYHDGGTFDWPQLYPVNASYSYADCGAIEVLQVRASDDQLLEFGQRKVSHCRYTIQDPCICVRRAVEARAAALAWKAQPWEHWDVE